jgi:general secretion pathway protein D
VLTVMKRPRLNSRLLLSLSVASLVTGCATDEPYHFDIPPARVAGLPRSQQGPDVEQATGLDDEGATAAPGSTKPFTSARSAAAAETHDGMTRLPAAPRTTPQLQRQDWSGRFPDTDQLVVALESMPLGEFINYSFSEALKANYVITQGLPSLDDPVTLNLDKPVSSRAYYKLVTDLLDTRGIGTTFRDGVFYLAPIDDKLKGNIPIGFGRRPQDVPDVPGKVMQMVPLRFGVNPSIERTINDLTEVQVKLDPAQSALFVTGERDQVLRALDVVSLLDQPSSRAREVGIVSLTYVGSKDLGEQLVTILENEGIPAAVGRSEFKSVAIVPLEQLGAIVVFAAGEDLLRRVEHWVTQLDRPSQGPELRYFIYHPRYARASDLGSSLAPLLGGAVAESGNLTRDTRSALGATPTTGTVLGPAGVPNAAVGSADSRTGTPDYRVTQENVLRRDTATRSTAPQAMSVQGQGLTLSVDPRSNTLVFYTTGQRYQALLPTVRRLDVPPKQVLLEATIAEVTLTGEFAYGVEFAFSSGEFSGGTLGNLGLPDGGFALNWIDSVTNQVRLKLSASNTLVNVLSNPTLVVRDGVEASIAVGNDVPTIGATAPDPLQSDTQITQVLYRKTGLDLRIRPNINAQGLVVMEITQNISNTVPGTSDVAGAPVFFERSVTTEVVARSGQSILLAGLISERQNDTTARVPGISKVPGLGWLFRSDTKSKEKTELVVLITPRVIDDPREWDSIRIGLQGALENLRLPEPSAATTSPNSVTPTRGGDATYYLSPQGGMLSGPEAPPNPPSQ